MQSTLVKKGLINKYTVGTMNDFLGKDPLKNCHGLFFCTIVSQERPLEFALENIMQDL